MIKEYLRPWKLAALAVGLAWLFWGALTEVAPDWDIAISVLMALGAYLTAPWSLRVWIKRRWRWWPLSLFYLWAHLKTPFAHYCIVKKSLKSVIYCT